MTPSSRQPEATLERLLSPHTADEFLASVWEERYLHVTRQENPALLGQLADLASFDSVDELLTTTYAAGRRPLGAVLMGRDGVIVPPDRYLTDRTETTARVDIGAVLDLYRAGASLILNGVNDASPPIGVLCNDLAEVFGVRVHANAYITPPNAQGFPLHADAHDVFMLQIAGQKAWAIHTAPNVPLDRRTLVPLEGDPATSGPVAHLDLRAGEVLYLPRGMLHEGSSSDEVSFHLTIGVTPYTWSDLLRDVASALEIVDVDFRRSAAPRLGALARGDVTPDEALLARLIARLVDGEHVRRAAHHKLGEETALRQGRLSHRGEFAKIAVSEGITRSTAVRVRSDDDLRIAQEDGHLRLSFSTRSLSLPAYTEPHVRQLCEGHPVCAADLQPDLDEVGRLVLVRRLVFEGLLEVTPG